MRISLTPHVLPGPEVDSASDRTGLDCGVGVLDYAPVDERETAPAVAQGQDRGVGVVVPGAH